MTLIPPTAASQILAKYGVDLFLSLAEIKKHYPDQVRELYRAMVKSIASEDAELVKEVLR